MRADAGYNVVGMFFPAKPERLPCACDNCGWKGWGVNLKVIEDCELTPGDPSPAGRCPKCDSLAYLDRPLDRAREHADALVKALRAGDLAAAAEALTKIDGKRRRAR